MYAWLVNVWSKLGFPNSEFLIMFGLDGINCLPLSDSSNFLTSSFDITLVVGALVFSLPTILQWESVIKLFVVIANL